MPDQLHPNGPTAPGVCLDKSPLEVRQPDDGMLRPFADEPGRWEKECHRLRRLAAEAQFFAPAETAAVRECLGRVDERTDWGWLRWQAPYEQSMPPEPLQIGLLPSAPSKAARLARRWLTRRPPLRAATGRSWADSVTVSTLFAALVSFTAGIYVMGLLPMGVVVPAMLLIPLYVSVLPHRLDALAHRFVRIIEGDPARAYLKRLILLHAQVARAAADSQIPELAHAARLGHRVLWDTAGLLAGRGTWPCCDERLLAYERLYTDLAQQALDNAAAQRALERAIVRPGTPQQIPSPRSKDTSAPADDQLLPPQVLAEATRTLVDIATAHRYAADRLKSLHTHPHAQHGSGEAVADCWQRTGSWESAVTSGRETLMSRKTPAHKLRPGSERDKVAAGLKVQYEAGASIRALAEGSGRSYGGVHRLLLDAGTQFRSRGGAGRKPAAA